MADTPRRQHFLTDIIDADQAAGRVTRVITRFPPEPNGYLHIGHAKSICLNFGLARDYDGDCHLRLDDTNPVKEDIDYVEAIQRDVAWLGFQWDGAVRFASDYFERMYLCAERMVLSGKAYVDSQTVEEIRSNRGDFGRPGVASPYRDRDMAENLDLFHRMRAGEFADGSHVLRARIDMAHANVLMRDPLMYRIRHAHHHRTGDAWCVYPMYDWAHPLEDAFEHITHSICTLEFESNRELYDWFLDNTVDPDTDKAWQPRPHQYEFARLALGYTLMSKRKLLTLVEEGFVSGWDDPRMPTIAGMRRRGVTADALRDFADLIGVAKNNSIVDIGKLEFCIRQDLEKRAPRALAVLKPLPVVLTNYPEDAYEQLELPWWHGQPERGVRKVPFSRELYIDRDDFAESPPADWKRLALGREVRLYGAYFVRCDEVVHDPATGEPALLRCSFDESTRGGEARDGRQPAGTIHWVDARRSAPTEIRLYDRLFQIEQPDAEGDFRAHLNPDSLSTVTGARVEPALANAAPGSHYQFVRVGYFCADPVESTPGEPVWNRVIGLRDTWTKTTGRQKDEGRPDRRKAEVKTDDAKPAAVKKTRAEMRAEQRLAAPEMAARYERYQRQLGLSADDADLLTADPTTAGFFDMAVTVHGKAASVARWLLNDLLGLAKDRPLSALPLDGPAFGRFVRLVDAGDVTVQAAKTLLAHLVAHGGDPATLVRDLKLVKVDDTAALSVAVDAVLAAHPAEVARLQAGEQKLIGVLIGAVMREMRSGADPAAVRRAVVARLATLAD
jgi:glutaminyl-tRNA synthetase